MPIDTLILFDLETSGLDQRKHDIIQVAACAYSITRNAVLDTFERKLRFDVRRAEPKALEVNGYDPEIWEREAVEPNAAWFEFDAFINAHKCVKMWSAAKEKHYYVAQGAGYNAAKFDGPWLAEKYKQSGRFLAMSFKVLDVMQLAMWNLRLRGVELEDDKQETVCKHFGIEYDAHDALADVLAMASLIGKLCGRENVTVIDGSAAQTVLASMESEFNRLRGR